MDRFEVGDVAVYQDQGLGRITAVGAMHVGGADLEVYTLRLETNGAILRVPTDRAARNGLRNVTPPEGVEAVFAVLRAEAQAPREKSWNRRQRALSDRMRTGKLLEIAAVLRDLTQLRHRRKDELSTGERQLMTQARNLVAHEVAASLQRPVDDVAHELDAALGSHTA